MGLRLQPNSVLNLGGGRGGLQVFGPTITYLLRDLFTTGRLAGAVNGTAAEPGPGARAVNDTGGNITISSGKLVVAGGTGTLGQAALWLTPAVTRLAGRAFALDYKCPAGAHTTFLGVAVATGGGAGAFDDMGFYAANTGLYARHVSAPTSPQIYTMAAGAIYRLYTVLRGNGRYLFLTDAGVTRLLYWDSVNNAAALYAGYSLLTSGSGGATELGALICPSSIVYQINALASDSFNRADAATLGATDGAGHAEANSGSGVAWVDRVGAFGIKSNAAQASAVSGVAVSTVDTGVVDHFASAKVTRSAGNAGIVLRYIDANNYISAYYNGTNVVVDRFEAGTSHVLTNGARTYAAGAELRAVAEGRKINCWYNDSWLGEATISTATFDSATSCGLYTSDTGNTFDDFVSFKRSDYTDLGAY